MSFEPTARQQKFQMFALELYEQGIFFRREWIKACRKIDDFDQAGPVTLKEFQNWTDEPGFDAWFHDVFPSPNGPSANEMSMMDWMFYNGIREAMKDQKEWGFKIYKSVRFGNQDGAKNGAKASDIIDFIGDAGESDAWREQIPAEA